LVKKLLLKTPIIILIPMLQAASKELSDWSIIPIVLCRCESNIRIEFSVKKSFQIAEKSEIAVA